MQLLINQHTALVKSHGCTLVSHRFQVGSLSPRAQLLMPANSFLGAFGMFSMVLKISSRSAFGLTIFPPLVGMPLMGAKRLQKQEQCCVIPMHCTIAVALPFVQKGYGKLGLQCQLQQWQIQNM
jgi:hypothetical protein